MEILVGCKGKRDYIIGHQWLPQDTADVDLEALGRFLDDLEYIRRKLKVSSATLAASFGMHRSTMSRLRGVYEGRPTKRRPTFWQFHMVTSFADKLREAEDSKSLYVSRLQLKH